MKRDELNTKTFSSSSGLLNIVYRLGALSESNKIIKHDIDSNENSRKNDFKYLNHKINKYQLKNEKEFSLINHKLDTSADNLNLIKKVWLVIKKHF